MTNRTAITFQDRAERIQTIRDELDAGTYDMEDPDKIDAVVDGVDIDLGGWVDDLDGIITDLIESAPPVTPPVHSNAALFVAVVVFVCIVGVGLIVLLVLLGIAGSST